MTAIVIDSLNTVPEDQVAVRAQVMQYLRVLAPNTRVAVYVMGERLRILHDFTGDLEALRARLAKLKIDYNIQGMPADELVRLQEMEAEHLNEAVESENDNDQDANEDDERTPTPNASRRSPKRKVTWRASTSITASRFRRGA